MSSTPESNATPPAATLGCVTPVLRFAGVGASVDDDPGRLGFPVPWRRAPAASVGRGRAALLLGEGDPGFRGSWVWIAADDVDRLGAEREARGARPHRPPGHPPRGSRECQVNDLDGDVLRFGSDLREGAPRADWLDAAGRPWRVDPSGCWRVVG